LTIHEKSWPQIKTVYLGLTKICVVVGVFMAFGLIKILNAVPIDFNALNFAYAHSVS